MPNMLAAPRGFCTTLALALALTACESRQPATAPREHAPPVTAVPAASAPDGAKPAGSPEGAHGSAPGADSLRLLAPGRAGMVRVGMRVGELRLRFGPALRSVTLRRGGEEFPAFAVGKVKGTTLPALLLEPLCEEGEDKADGSPSDNCRIWRITVHDPAYRTRSGVGVGSRYGDVRLAAPLSFVGPNPMGIAATAEDWRMNFLLDAAAVEARNLPVRRETIHDTVRVVAVQLYR